MRTKNRTMGLLDYMTLDEDEKRDFFVSIETTQSPLIPQKLKNLGGRPRSKYPIGVRRAFVIWQITQKFPPEKRKNLTNRVLIEKAKKLDSKPLFSSAQNTLEQSLSRGKQELEIDESWNSKVCEKLAEGL
jgi:hypothetical protein